MRGRLTYLPYLFFLKEENNVLRCFLAWDSTVLLLPVDIQPGAVLPMQPLHTDPDCCALQYPYSSVGRLYQFDRDATPEVTTRPQVGLSQLGGKATIQAFQCGSHFCSDRIQDSLWNKSSV